MMVERQIRVGRIVSFEMSIWRYRGEKRDDAYYIIAQQIRGTRGQMIFPKLLFFEYHYRCRDKM